MLTRPLLLTLSLLGTAPYTNPWRELEQYREDARRVRENLATFDTLDFEVFTNQKWNQLHHSHGKNIISYMQQLGLAP